MSALEEIDEMRRRMARRDGYADGMIVGRWQLLEDGAGTIMGVPFTVSFEWPEGEPPDNLMRAARDIARDMQKRNA
jgi:hypothetical protein